MKKLIPVIIIAFVWLVSYTFHRTPFNAWWQTPLVTTEIFIGVGIVKWLIERKK